MRYEYVVKIAAPPGKVWSTLIDVEHWPQWTESMIRVQRLDDGPLSVGRTARVHQPKMRPMVWTVTELAPEQSFTWATATAGLRLVAGHDLTPETGGVSALLSLQVTGWLAPLVTLFIGPRIRRYLQMEAEGLKRHTEPDGRGADGDYGD
jgi:uncharacterized protein YndB with AHSA1/START domain